MTLTLTDEEAEGLRELLAFLAVFERNGYDIWTGLYQCTTHTWDDMTRSPKAKLSRFAVKPLLDDRRPSGG